MKNKTNIAELLKDCPKGMELDCTICNNVVTLEGVDTVGYYPIRITSKDGFNHVLTHEGCIYKREDAKCVIFPKGKTTWEGFIPPIQPKFKAGDKVKRTDADYTYIVTIAKLDDDYYDYVNEDGQCGVIHISTQDDWELVPNKFDTTTLKPFDKVLVRHNKDNQWCGSFFSHIDDDFHSHCYKYVTITGKSYPMCIPYEGNEHLLGTTDDCDEYFKNW